MTLIAPLNANDTVDLLDRKTELVGAISQLATTLNIEIDYSFDMMVAARDAGVRNVEFLEMLVELEAIKYTLCARRLREELSE
jgi:hypothetical protein